MFIEEAENKTLIQHNAYYISLQNSTKTVNEKNITISIPRQNLLTQKTLKQLMINTSDIRDKIMSMVANSKIQK